MLQELIKHKINDKYYDEIKDSLGIIFKIVKNLDQFINKAIMSKYLKNILDVYDN